MSEIDELPENKNFNIASDVINETVRVSTAGIWLGLQFGDYLQYESWIFSNDKAVQRSVQVIHGTSGRERENLRLEAIKIHGYLVANMKTKFKV